MLRLLDRYRTPLVLLAAVLLPLLVYRANAVEPADANVLDKLILGGTAPIRRFLMGTTGGASDLWYRYVDLAHARREYGELARRLREAELERDRLEHLARENESLARLLELKRLNPEARQVAAHVIGAGTSPASRTLEIDRGSLDGVRRGDVVLSGAGLVGLVQRVAWTSAEVVLIADEKVSFRALLLRSRARGWIRGQGLVPGYTLKLTDVLRSDDVAPGDRIVTSGLGGVFPKGIPIGVVTNLEVEPGEQHRVAKVEPYVDFARLEAVTVLLDARAGAPLATPEPLLPPSLRGSAGPEETPSASEGAEGGVPREGGASRDAGAPWDAGAPRDGDGGASP